MGVIFSVEKRNIIPRWRSILRTANLKEITLISSTKKQLPFENHDYLVEQKKAWLENVDLAHAGDLLSSAFVLGVNSEFENVAKYILDNEPNTTSPISKLAKKTLKIVESADEKNFVNDYQQQHEKVIQDIKKCKWYLRRENRNPLVNLEIGRLYTVLGQTTIAKKHIDIALSLDKDNRYIARSSSRFYHHISKDQEKALHIIKNSEFIKNDPWLLSAEIAYSSIMDRHSRMAKVGMNFLKHYNEDSGAITELASALGTLEYKSGNNKESQRYFKTALIQPNDNSLAQVGWILNKEKIGVDILKYDVPLAYEANAHSFYKLGKFQESLDYSLKWLDDEPYSTRPVLLAAALYGTFLNKRNDGIRLLYHGLEINPNDIKLTNDLVYYLLLDNKVDAAFSLFKGIIKELPKDVDEGVKIPLVATLGLYHYRIEQNEKGRDLYLDAITRAKRLKNNYLLSLAMVNYVREELRYSNEPEILIKELDAVCKNSPYQDVTKGYEEIVNSITKP